MFRSPRRFVRGLALVALGFLLASMVSGSASGALAAIFFLPILLLKIAMFVFLVGLVLKVVTGRWGPGGGWPHERGRRWDQRWSPRPPRAGDGSRWWYRGEPMDTPRRSAPEPPVDRDRADWEESMQRARAEVEGLDRPYR